MSHLVYTYSIANRNFFYKVSPEQQEQQEQQQEQQEQEQLTNS